MKQQYLQPTYVVSLGAVLGVLVVVVLLAAVVVLRSV